jgi:hypothetical protein
MLRIAASGRRGLCAHSQVSEQRKKSYQIFHRTQAYSQTAASMSAKEGSARDSAFMQPALQMLKFINYAWTPYHAVRMSRHLYMTAIISL